MTWIKSRSNSFNHQLFGPLRGPLLRLSPNENYSQASSDTVRSLDSNGFTLGTEQAVNNDGSTYVAWNWNAGDTTEVVGVGDDNDKAYNTDQIWSNSLSGTLYSGSAAELFDGDTGTRASVLGNTMTFTPSGGLEVQRVLLSTTRPTSLPIGIGLTVALMLPTPSKHLDLITVPFSGTLTSFEWQAPTSGELINVATIQPDGVALV